MPIAVHNRHNPLYYTEENEYQMQTTGLEPVYLAISEPKSDVSSLFTTSAYNRYDFYIAG